MAVLSLLCIAATLVASPPADADRDTVPIRALGQRQTTDADRDTVPVRALGERTGVPGENASERPPGADKSTSDRSPRRPSGRLSMGPMDAISQETLFAYLDDLTAIRPFLGWRNSATRGEAEAVQYVRDRLSVMTHLMDLGMELEEQEFHTYHGTEFWQTCLELTVDGTEYEVPADGHPGHRSNLSNAILQDTDGALNDSDSNPIMVHGQPVIVRTDADIDALTSNQVRGRIVFADYTIFDYYLRDINDAWLYASQLVNLDPAGIVLVTSFSDVLGVSHGVVAGDLNIFIYLNEMPPILNLRLEDLAALGIHGWDGLSQVSSARMTLDVDVFSPGHSRNLIARIPGQDPSRAMIVSGHIDSPNNPGALDDGSGVVTVLELARVLNRTATVPPVDLYLVWYGSHERGLFGSANFVSAHQELLDRTIAMFQVDCLTVPVRGLTFDLYLETWSYARLGDDSMPWPDYVSQLGDEIAIQATPLDALALVSDNSNYSGFDVPNFDLISMDPSEGIEVHYDGFLHCPYDTADLARQEGDTLEDMARLVLAAVLRTGVDNPQLRVTPEPDGRVVFVASHTEGVHMAPTSLTDFGMTLAWKGLDVDLVPFGQEVTAADLVDADMVVVLPVHDYPCQLGDVDLYDVGWGADEVDALVDYVEAGGFLVMTNCRNRLKYYNMVLEANEDWADMNDLAQRFGVEYTGGRVLSPVCEPEGNPPLMYGVNYLELATQTGVPFTITHGEIIAMAGSHEAMALVEYGSAGGEVLVVADVSVFGDSDGDPINMRFWRNLADHARSR